MILATVQQTSMYVLLLLLLGMAFFDPAVRSVALRTGGKMNTEQHRKRSESKGQSPTSPPSKYSSYATPSQPH